MDTGRNIPRTGGVFSPRPSESKIDMKHTELFRHHLGVNDPIQFPEHVNMRAVQPVIDTAQHGYSNPIVDNRFWSYNYLDATSLHDTVFDTSIVCTNYGATIKSGSIAATQAIPINHYMRITSADMIMELNDDVYSGFFNGYPVEFAWYVLVAGTGTTTPRFVANTLVYIRQYTHWHRWLGQLRDLVLAPGDFLYGYVVSRDDRNRTWPTDITTAISLTVQVYGTLAPLGCYPPCSWS